MIQCAPQEDRMMYIDIGYKSAHHKLTSDEKIQMIRRQL